MKSFASYICESNSNKEIEDFLSQCASKKVWFIEFWEKGPNMWKTHTTNYYDNKSKYENELDKLNNDEKMHIFRYGETEVYKVKHYKEETWVSKDTIENEYMVWNNFHNLEPLK